MKDAYDLVIIGGGVAGLYTAYHFLKKTPNAKLIVFEKNDHLCGRWEMGYIGKTHVSLGAGIIRKSDVLVNRLREELEVEVHEFTVAKHIPSTVRELDVNKIMVYLRHCWTKLSRRDKYTIAFRPFALKHLKAETYKTFLINTGYTDFEKATAYNTLFIYKMENNVSGWKAYAVNWDLFRDKLAEAVGKQNLSLRSIVHKVRTQENTPYRFKIDYTHTSYTGRSYERTVFAKCAVFACRKDQLFEPQLLPSSVNKSLLRSIQGQPFLRAYARFSPESRAILSTVVPDTTVVPGPLQEIIPIHRRKGIYMVAYNDNMDANIVKEHLEDTEENRAYFERIVEKSLGLIKGVLSIEKIMGKYWENGIHYYGPLPEKYWGNYDAFLRDAQRPLPGLYIVGEMVSKQHGWAEGALQSVSAIMKDLWKEDL